jgi:hypothetical protein
VSDTPARLAPSDWFACTRYSCRLMAGVCVRRQAGAERDATLRKVRPLPELEFCASGKCAQGAEIRARVEGSPLPAPTPPPTTRPEADPAEGPRPLRAILREVLARLGPDPTPAGADRLLAEAEARIATSPPLPLPLPTPSPTLEAPMAAQADTDASDATPADAGPPMCADPDHKGPPAEATRKGLTRCKTCVGRDWDRRNRLAGRGKPRKVTPAVTLSELQKKAPAPAPVVTPAPAEPWTPACLSPTQRAAVLESQSPEELAASARRYRLRVQAEEEAAMRLRIAERFRRDLGVDDLPLFANRAPSAEGNAA